MMRQAVFGSISSLSGRGDKEVYAFLADSNIHIN